MAKNLKFSHEEGQTPIEDLSGLLLPIRTMAELNDAEAKNNAKAYAQYLVFMPALEKLNLLAVQSLCGIHREMFGEVWSWAGELRKGGVKNIGCVSVQIGSEFHKLMAEERRWEEEKRPVLEIVARIHHRLVWIHPFENGNGRWARLVANIYLRQRALSLLEWPKDIKFIRENFRPQYLTALKKADHGDFEALIELHRDYSN